MTRGLTPVLLALCLVAGAFAQEPAFTRTEDVIYGRKFGTVLKMDVFQPGKAHGWPEMGKDGRSWRTGLTSTYVG